jgi:hypothetical protein
MALTIIEKCKGQLLANDFNAKILDVNEIRVDAYGPLNTLLKSIFKEKSRKKVWAAVIADANRWTADPEPIRQLWNHFDPTTLCFTIPMDSSVLAVAFQLTK